MINIGMIGLGTVGQSVINILSKNREIIKSRIGQNISVTRVSVKNLSKNRNINSDILISNNSMDIVNDENIDIVIEVMGGVEDAFILLKQALKNRKAVVTANKALLAYHRYELKDLANDTPFMYEASTAGGIPIINALKNGLSANNIISIHGILNGTCNYILTKMTNNPNLNYIDILKEAQDLGYAEADPLFDVGGFDTSHKLLILASIAYNIDAKPEDILIEGIENITQSDIQFAKEFGYQIKLLGIAKEKDKKVELRVHPTMLSNAHIMSQVDGVMNSITVTGDMVGETMYYGAGAGGDATASAIVADIIEIARDIKNPMLGYKIDIKDKYTLLKSDEIISQYYLRLTVNDDSGVLLEITSILNQIDISIKSILQKPSYKNNVEVLLTTHNCKEKNIQKAISELSKLNFQQKKIFIIRIEN